MCHWRIFSPSIELSTALQVIDMSGKNKNEVQFMEPPPFCEAHFLKMSGNKSMLLSLKESAIDTIVTNIGSYRDLIKKKISPPMRKIVLDKVMERIEEIGEDQVWAALPYLDQHRTTESFSIRDFADILFCLNWKTGELSNGRVSMEEFLQYLIEFVPNLQQLEIDVPGSIHVKTIKLQPLVATDLLLKMENLTEVTINGFDIQFSGFVRVCKESRNLQSIKADNILVDVPKISMKKILEAIGSLFGYQYYVDFEFPKKIEITLKKTDAITPPLKLLKAVVTGDFLDLIPSSLAELCIHAGKTAEIQSEGDCILRNLRRLGGSLKLLLLNGIRPEMNLTFNYIFEHCRGLETLTIRNSWVTADGPIASFGKLTHFYLLDENSFCTARLDRILSAPLLQVVRIIAFKLDLGDKESLFDQIRNRTILTQLRNIRILYLYNRAKRNLNERDFHELSHELRLSGVQSVDIQVANPEYQMKVAPILFVTTQLDPKNLAHEKLEVQEMASIISGHLNKLCNNLNIVV